MASAPDQHTPGQHTGAQPARAKRADARRNQQALLDAAAAVFVGSGVEAPIRDIAAAAGVGTATIYRHQVEACAAAGPSLLRSSPSPYAALTAWIDLFVDFLVTKHGLAAVLQSDDSCFDPLHAYFLERLVPVCGDLLDAAAGAGEIHSSLEAVELMRGVGSLCIGADRVSGHDPRRLVEILIAGLRA